METEDIVLRVEDLHTYFHTTLGTVRALNGVSFTVPKGKVSGLMGVMNLLQHKFDRLDVALAAEHGEISEQEYEDKIQEAFRQLGIEVVDE